jgi:hypothetical protein
MGFPVDVSDAGVTHTRARKQPSAYLFLIDPIICGFSEYYHPQFAYRMFHDICIIWSKIY